MLSLCLRHCFRSTAYISQGDLCQPRKSREPLIEFHITGVIALCAADGSHHFDVGIIKGADDEAEIKGHTHLIEVIKRSGDTVLNRYTIVDGITPAKRLRLELDGAGAGSGIQLFRSQTGDDARFSYDHVLNISRDLYDGGQVRINKDCLRTVLRVSGIDEAVFSVTALTEVAMLTEDDNGTLRAFDETAFVVKGVIALPLGGATFERWNDVSGEFEGACPPLTVEDGVTYEVIVTNACDDNGCDLGDVLDYYNDFLPDAEDGRRVRFVQPQQVSFSTVTVGCPVIDPDDPPGLG